MNYGRISAQMTNAELTKFMNSLPMHHRQNRAEIEEVYNKLSRVLDWCEYSYKIIKIPVLSDKDYDFLKRYKSEYDVLFPELNTIRADVPAVIRYSESFHRKPWLSEYMTYNPSVLVAWIQSTFTSDTQATIEHHLDGCTVKCIYINGRLVWAITRGDGCAGSNITAVMYTVDCGRYTRLTPHPPKYIEIVGKLTIGIKDLLKINAERITKSRTPYATPAIAARDLALHAQGEHLHFIVNGVPEYTQSNDTLPKFANESDLLCALRDSYGFKLALIERWFPHKEHIDRFINDACSLNRAYECFVNSGFVVKVDSMELRNTLGTSNGLVNWACKIVRQNSCITEVTKIEWFVNRHRELFPAVYFTPTTITDSIAVNCAVLPDSDTYCQLHIHEGCHVAIIYDSRQRVVITAKVSDQSCTHQFDENDINEYISKMPAFCPACGVRVAHCHGSGRLYCTNTECHGAADQKLQNRGNV